MPVSDLSGGEQSRILLAHMMRQPADLLILDEPGNDLDIPTLEVLEESLSDFPGALVLVTHDRFMLDRLSTELLALDGKGNARRFVDFAQWQAFRDTQEEEAAAQKSAPVRPAVESTKPAQTRKRLTWAEQRELEQMEEKVMAAEETLHGLQKLIEDPTTLADHVKLREICTKIDAAQTTVTDLYARWQELESRKA